MNRRRAAPRWTRYAVCGVALVAAILAVVLAAQLFSGTLRLLNTDGGPTTRDPQFAEPAENATRPPELDENGRPCVRTVNSYYENGSFYIVTYALSDKMKQIEICPDAAICGDWFTAKGTGENLGHVLSEDNLPLIQRLREVFAEWYSGGHVDESDPNTCILRIRLTEGVLFSNGTRYEIDFT